MPALLGWHNFMRGKFKWYYDWHLSPWAKTVHIIGLLYVILTAAGALLLPIANTADITKFFASQASLEECQKPNPRDCEPIPTPPPAAPETSPPGEPAPPGEPPPNANPPPGGFLGEPPDSQPPQDQPPPNAPKPPQLEPPKDATPPSQPPANPQPPYNPDSPTPPVMTKPTPPREPSPPNALPPPGGKPPRKFVAPPGPGVENPPGTVNYGITIDAENSSISQLAPGPKAADPLTPVALALVAVAAITGFFASPLVSTALTEGLLNGSSFLHFFFFGYAPDRKRRPWGVVMDARTDLPVAGAKVLLYESVNLRLVDKTATDDTGRYGFLAANPGRYLILVSQPQYVDWRSGELTVDNPHAGLISFDIRLTPSIQKTTALYLRANRLRAVLRWITVLHWPVLIGGTILSAVLFFLFRDFANALALTMYGVIWFAKALYFFARDEKLYGSVRSSATRMGVGLALVRLTGTLAGERRYHRSTVTDRLGRFLLFTKRGTYTATATKAGFDPTSRELDVWSRQFVANIEIVMNPAQDLNYLTISSPTVSPLAVPVYPTIPPATGQTNYTDGGQNYESPI